jgi:Transcription-repair coupling factor (superfamily II helicase)
LQFSDQANVDPARIIKLLQDEPQTYRLDGSNKLRISKDLPEIQDRFTMLENLLCALDVRHAA